MLLLYSSSAHINVNEYLLGIEYIIRWLGQSSPKEFVDLYLHMHEDRALWYGPSITNKALKVVVRLRWERALSKNTSIIDESYALYHPNV